MFFLLLWYLTYGDVNTYMQMHRLSYHSKFRILLNILFLNFVEHFFLKAHFPSKLNWCIFIFTNNYYYCTLFYHYFFCYLLRFDNKIVQ